MKVELPGWATAAGALLLLAAAVAVPYVWMQKGAAEDRARTLEDSMEAAIVRAETTEKQVSTLRDSLAGIQDSLALVSLELVKSRKELTGTILSTIDTLEVRVPDTAKPLVDRLRRQVDSLRRVHREEQRVWEQRFATQEREIGALEKLYRAEHKARLAAQRAQEEAMDALDPPFWTSVAGSLPEAGAKLGAGAIACSGELPLEACVSYVGALGIDFIFDL